MRVYKSGGSLESGNNYKTYCRKSQFLSTSDENETANSVSTWELMGTGNQDREFWDGSIKWKNPGYTTGKTMPPFMRAEWYQQARFAHFDICQVNFGNTDYISGIKVFNMSVYLLRERKQRNWFYTEFSLQQKSVSEIQSILR